MGLSIIDFPSTLRRWAKIHRLAWCCRGFGPVHW